MHKAIFQALFGHFNGNGESSKALAAIGDETRQSINIALIEGESDCKKETDIIEYLKKKASLASANKALDTVTSLDSII
ncbi:hypothetical protein MHB56_23370 [Paenibacillus sp. FSL H8-0315]|uniref:hypothetical protein n=1 Tax=Paenibacillus sp. FSL H8-0315 TaxID=2921384 RepID=UPI0030F92D94